jgi:succinyl-diaminopimelate desuccinylase
MKGAIACYVAAVSRFVAEHKDFQGSLSFLITMDEEGPAINGTKKMLQWLEERGEKLDFCLVGEPTNPHRLGEMIKIGRRGSMNCTLKVKGQQGHAAYPQFARNPVTEMIKITHALKQTAIDDGTDYFQPSNLEITSIDTGNEATNVIPASCVAKFNIRFNDVHSSEYLKAWITEICDKNSADYDLHMQVTGEAFQTEPNQFIKNMQQMIAEKTGEETELSTTGGTSDARFIKDYCPVVEFGTTGRTAHQVDENVALETLHSLTDIYFEALKLYFNTETTN